MVVGWIIRLLLRLLANAQHNTLARKTQYTRKATVKPLKTNSYALAKLQSDSIPCIFLSTDPNTLHARKQRYRQIIRPPNIISLISSPNIQEGIVSFQVVYSKQTIKRECVGCLKAQIRCDCLFFTVEPSYWRPLRTELELGLHNHVPEVRNHGPTL